MSIRLSDEEQTLAIDSLRQFWDDTLDEEIGELRARQILGFVVREIGPCVYNRAIGDARRWLEERAGDLDASLFETPFPGRSGGKTD